MLKRLLSLSALIVGLAFAPAQAQDELVWFFPCTETVLPLSAIDTSPVVNPEAMATVASSRRAGLTWNIIYRDVNNTTGVGFDDPTLGATRRQTLESVLAYVDSILTHGSATIEVDVQNSLTTGSGFLASAGTLFFTGPAGFQGGISLQHITTGVDPAPGNPDIVVTVNFGYNWNSGLNPVSSGQYDLYTVLIHEIGHGLGFASLSDSSGASTVGTNVRSFLNRDMRTGNAAVVFNQTTGAFEGTASWLTGSENGIVFIGAGATAGNGGTSPALYTPGTFQQGSSLSHWASALAGGTTVMQPSIGTNTPRRQFLALERAAFGDLGYTMVTNATLVASPASLSFGSIPAGTQSASQITMVTGFELDGSTVTVSAPPAGFQTSLNGSTWGTTSLVLPYSGSNLGGSPVYVRFTPAASGAAGGSITITGGNSGGTSFSVSGTGTSTLTRTPASLSFGEAAIGTSTASQTFEVSGAGLDGSTVTVGAPPAGFETSLNNSTWGTTPLNLPYTAPTLGATTVYVRFTPVASGAASGNISISGGAASSVTVGVSGSATPTLSRNPTSLSFGEGVIGTSTAAQTFDVSGVNLTGATVTVGAPPPGFETSPDGIAWGTTSFNLSYSAPNLGPTTVHVRYAPVAPGAASGDITISGGGATSVTVNVSGNATSTLTRTPASLSFGSSDVGVATASQSFEVEGYNLGGAAVSVGAPPSGFQTSLDDSSWGTTSLNLPYTPPDLGPVNVYVRFLPLAEGAAGGNITVSGGGASSVAVSVSGSGNPVTAVDDWQLFE